MRIKDIKLEKHKIELVKPFRVSLGTIEDFYTLLLKVYTDEGISGIGEGSPLEMITGETIETTLAAAEDMKKMLIGRSPFDIGNINADMEKFFPHNPSARAAYDIALHDICAKSKGLPLYKYLGGTVGELRSDVTIPIDTLENITAMTLEHINSGFEILKIKVGRGKEEDIETVRAVRMAAGSDATIFIDANQGWTRYNALDIIQKIYPYNILLVEQPLEKYDLEGLAQLNRQSEIPIMADESIFSPEDAKKAVKINAADYVNIKLMKCGGLYNAVKINAICQQAGIRCVTGCMMDTPVAIAAAASFVSARDNVIFGDLDSLMHIKDCGIKSVITQNGSNMILSNEPGLGMDINL